MLKFRMTNSMRARKAAEAQRRALEEKLKMEWAWKPMAAVMNEKETDLVYWVPPLYTATLLTDLNLASTPSSINSTPTNSIRRKSLRSASLASQGSIRRKRLAKRRIRLSSPSGSIHETIDEKGRRKTFAGCMDFVAGPKRKKSYAGAMDEINVEGYGEEDDENETGKKEPPTTDDDKESGIQDEYLDSSLEYENQLPHSETMFVRPRRESRHSRHSKRGSKRRFSRFTAPKEEKLKYVPALLKVIDKIAQLYLMPIKPNLNTLRRNSRVAPNGSMKRSSFSKTSISRKPKRPSVKVYSVPPSQRSSIRRSLKPDEETPDPFYVITSAKKPFKKQSLKEKKSTDSKSKTHIGLPTLTESELQNAHLEMILKILTNLYEEKLSNQTSEIENLKSKLQNQEKILKHTAHLALDLKRQVRSIKAQFDFNQDIEEFYKFKRASVISVPYELLEPPDEFDEKSCELELSKELKKSKELTAPNEDTPKKVSKPKEDVPKSPEDNGDSDTTLHSEHLEEPQGNKMQQVQIQIEINNADEEDEKEEEVAAEDETEDHQEDEEEDRSEKSRVVSSSYISMAQVYPISYKDDEEESSSSVSESSYANQTVRTVLNIEISD